MKNEDRSFWSGFVAGVLLGCLVGFIIHINLAYRDWWMMSPEIQKFEDILSPGKPIGAPCCTDKVLPCPLSLEKDGI